MSFSFFFLFLNLFKFKKPLLEDLCRTCPRSERVGLRSGVDCGGVCVCGFTFKSQHSLCFDITHRQLHHFLQVSLQLLTSVCMCHYASPPPTLYTHTHHTPAPPHTRTQMANRERGEGPVGGNKSKDTEHLVVRSSLCLI